MIYIFFSSSRVATLALSMEMSSSDNGGIDYDGDGNNVDIATPKWTQTYLYVHLTAQYSMIYSIILETDFKRTFVYSL